MGIIARYSHRGNVHLPTPGRIYLHRAGHGIFIERSVISPIKGAALYAQDILTSRLHSLEQYAFVIGVLWGDRRDKVLDLFGYSDIDPSSRGEAWKSSNPDVELWVVREGDWVSEGRTCEDTAIILGREGEHRRRTEGLVEFLETSPHLGNLEPTDERYRSLKLWMPAI